MITFSRLASELHNQNWKYSFYVYIPCILHQFVNSVYSVNSNLHTSKYVNLFWSNGKVILTLYVITEL